MDGTCLPNTIRLRKLSCPQKGRHSSPSTFAWRDARYIPLARPWPHLPGNKDTGLPQPRRRPVIEFPNCITSLANVRSMCWGTVPPLSASLSPPRRLHGGPSASLNAQRTRPSRLCSPPPAPGAGSCLPHSFCTSSNIDQVSTSRYEPRTLFAEASKYFQTTLF